MQATGVFAREVVLREALALKVSTEDRAVLETLARYAFARPGFRALTTVKYGDGSVDSATFEILHHEDGPIVRRLTDEPGEFDAPTPDDGAVLVDDTALQDLERSSNGGHDVAPARTEAEIEQSHFDDVLVQAAFRTPDLLAIFSSGGRELRWCNEAFERALGPAVNSRPRLVELLDDWSQGHFMVKGLAALIRQSWWRGRLTFEGQDDNRITVAATVIAHRDTEGDIDSLSLSATPIDEELVPEPADDAAALGALVEHVSELLAVIDRNGRIRFASPGISHLLQRRAGGLVGLDFLGLIHPDDAVRDVSGLVQVDPEGNGAPIRLRLRASDQSWRHLDAVVTDLRSNSAIGGFVLSAHDVTERVESFDRLAAEAFTDPDTGLPNRFRLLDRLTTLLRDSRSSGAAAVLLVDLDGLRNVNDHGLAFGDAFLVEVAKRLVDSAGPGAFVARLRSDEFAVVLPDVVDAAVGRRVADALRVALAKPFEREDTIVRVTASIGVALGRSGEDPDELLRRADLACIDAKQVGGGNTTVLWGAEMARRESRRRDVELQLRHALDHAGVQPHYQPIVDLATGKVVGAEALLRVRDTDGALLTPGEFVGAAESAGLLSQLGSQVLSATCEQLVIWGGQMRADAPRHLAVNISPRQLNDASLPAQVMAALGEAAIDPESLWLELTEGMLLAHQEVDQDRVRFLRELGVRVGLDEFGAGYSNLSYVRRFPLDFVKIDRSLIGGLGEDERDTAVVRATIELARDLGLTVVAVGVENDRQLDVLMDLGCELAQGYLFSPPVSPDEFAQVGRRSFISPSRLSSR
jgi:diguanylate cyclase (GGDEF)-like protein/PAS domain S-box-containing protein